MAEGADYTRVMAFDRALRVGQRVAVRWTWNYGYYCDTGIVVKLNAKSARVQLDGAKPTYLPAGHVVFVPRVTDLDKWSWNNGVFPPECPA